MNKTELSKLMERLWNDYSQLNPQASKVHALLTAKGEVIQNDHIAFRSIQMPGLGIPTLEVPFLDAGYKMVGEYQFKEKKLFAQHYEHSVDPTQPKIFISELLISEFSKDFQKNLMGLFEQISHQMTQAHDFIVSGRRWELSHALYEALYKESEYGAWLAAFGYRVNHFTVYFNSLKTFVNLIELNSFLKSQGFLLNASGGEVKGTPEEFLEQSSTMAHPIDVKFTDGVKKIPGCYYEFAKRYPMPNGRIYQGFVAASADKLFESTHQK